MASCGIVSSSTIADPQIKLSQTRRFRTEPPSSGILDEPSSKIVPDTQPNGDRYRMTPHCLRNHLDGLMASRRSAVRPRSRLWAVDGPAGSWLPRGDCQYRMIRR